MLVKMASLLTSLLAEAEVAMEVKVRMVFSITIAVVHQMVS